MMICPPRTGVGLIIKHYHRYLRGYQTRGADIVELHKICFVLIVAIKHGSVSEYAVPYTGSFSIQAVLSIQCLIVFRDAGFCLSRM